MAIKFIIDSASDILPEEAQAMGMVHLAQRVSFDDVEFRDSVDLTHREFYLKLVESDVIPHTSQIPPSEYIEACESVIAAGDTPIIITMSSKLSGTYQSAVIAASECSGDVFVIDSENVALGERILILRGLELVEQGLSAEEIFYTLKEEAKKIRIMALVDTLEYMKKGGRVSAAAALVGGVLSIKPVIAIENGEIIVIGKARGSKKANNLLREMVEKAGGINFDKPFALAYSGLSDELLMKYVDDSRELYAGYTGELPICTIGCAVGTHAGPGAVAVAFFEK